MIRPLPSLTMPSSALSSSILSPASISGASGASSDPSATRSKGWSCRRFRSKNGSSSALYHRDQLEVEERATDPEESATDLEESATDPEERYEDDVVLVLVLVHCVVRIEL